MTYIGIIEKEESTLYHIKTCVVNVKGCSVAFACSSFKEYQQLSEDKKKVDILFIGFANEFEGLNTVAKIKREDNTTQVVFIISSNNEIFLLKAIKVGVVGFLKIPFSQSVFEECVSNILSGKSFLSYELQRKVFDQLHLENASYSNVVSPDLLTERETDIVRLILKGYTNKEIGDSLFISHHTVNEHLKRVFRKLNVNSRVKLIYKIVADLNLYD
jgi:DNA-binding NarL/FixJ family response regulator